jgi:hypothetical protein
MACDRLLVLHERRRVEVRDERAWDGVPLMAVMAITFVWPTSEADTAGVLFSRLRTTC